MSSVQAPYSMASTHSGMSSPALGPMIQAPRILSVSLSLINLTCLQKQMGGKQIQHNQAAEMHARPGV
jgi:hypothetical protein